MTTHTFIKAKNGKNQKWVLKLKKDIKEVLFLQKKLINSGWTSTKEITHNNGRYEMSFEYNNSI